MSQNTTNAGGIGFLGLLGILFIGLKLAGIIHWSWWLVLLPLYGGLALVVGLAVVATIIAGIAAVGVAIGRKVRGHGRV